MCRNTNLSVSFSFIYVRSSRGFASFVTGREFLPEENIQVKTFTPFVYIDVSDPSNTALYIQPLPSTYNVTEYKAWLINNDTKSTIVTTIVLANKDRGHIRHNISAPDGVYHVKVAALHPECGEHGCVNSTTPYIYISKLKIFSFFFFFLISGPFSSTLLISYSHRTRVSSTANYDNQLNMDTTCAIVRAVPRV